MTTPTSPGIFLARSKITSPALSHEIFTKWYEQVHIPDIFKISDSFEGVGIISGFRYYSTSPRTTKKPYLAIYPLEDVGYLEMKEFWSTPVEHAILDEASGKKETKCFELAEFDMLPYELLKVTQLETSAKGNIKTQYRFQFPILPDYRPRPSSDNAPILHTRLRSRKSPFLTRSRWHQKNSPLQNTLDGEE